MKWTAAPPTTPGWYWWREALFQEARVVEVYCSPATASLVARWCRVENMKGEWAGPIPLPQEKPSCPPETT